ncbi:hypothetical protein ACFV4E_22935 [Streptomyces hygroscopicus]|uniref:Uncharacterized protein n=1 Tax=Streptomyces hygroscopicus TaxID=1912 RepID=A0ABQ3UGD8_STRHY|nr:hypothetical protein [Streptomyces hygroscopicus]GHJ34326.1 hypothetical protein TPA0910_87590 [Streptomyces hygroscopicus]
MKPQHTGARTHDLSTWGTADLETSQHLAATGQTTAAQPGTPVPTATSSDEHTPAAPANAHRLAA